MARIEPRIDSFVLVDERGRGARFSAGPARSVLRRSLDWLGVVLLFAVIAVFALALAVHQQWVEIPSGVDVSQLPAKVLFIGGFALIVAAQFIGAVRIFGRSIGQGMLALLVPGYAYLALRRQGDYAWMVGTMLAGWICIAAGTIYYA